MMVKLSAAFANFAGPLSGTVPEQVSYRRMISIDGYVQRRASVADGIYLSVAKQQLFYGSQLAVEDCFGKRRVAELFSRINIGALIQQVANDFEPALTSGEKKRHATVAARVNVGAREMKQLHAMETSIYRSLREISLS